MFNYDGTLLALIQCMKSGKHWAIAISIPLLLLGAVLLTAQAQSSDHLQDEDLSARAHVLFEYDQEHPHHLPDNRLRALALALEFGNSKGTEAIVNELEARLRLSHETNSSSR